MAKKSKRRPPKRSWSLLVYIAGDNDLSDFGLEDIREMCETGASASTHVAVEIDTEGDYTGSIRYEIGEPDWSGHSYRRVIERLPEKDSGHPETLRDFLRWGIGRCSAEKRLVVVWNHGAGFRMPARDIAYDDYGTSLDMVDIESAFRQAGVTKGNKFSILGFDACLMNMLEIAHHLKDQVEFLVGSQEIEPGEGWPRDPAGCRRRDSANECLYRQVRAHRAGRARFAWAIFLVSIDATAVLRKSVEVRRASLQPSNIWLGTLLRCVPCLRPA